MTTVVVAIHRATGVLARRFGGGGARGSLGVAVRGGGLGVTVSEKATRMFRRICNPPEGNISICNAIEAAQNNDYNDFSRGVKC